MILTLPVSALLALGALLCSSSPAFAASQSVISAFGGAGSNAGSGPGAFSEAFGVAVDQASGDVYVVDLPNNRVEEFSANGVFISAFGSEGSSAGQLNIPRGIAVEQLTGDVYVSDLLNHRIDEFTATGAFVRAFGWGVANGASEAQVCTSTCQAGLAGAGAGQFGEEIGEPAIEPASGDVFVTDPYNSRIDVFSPAGVFVRAFGWGVADGASKPEVCTSTCQAGLPGSHAGQFGEFSPRSVAFSASGLLYVVDSGNERVQQLDASGAVLRENFGVSRLEGYSPSAVAVNPANEAVYISANGYFTPPNGGRQYGPQVLEFGAGGSLVATNPEVVALPSSNRLAAASTTGYAYYSTGNRVLILSSASAPPPLAEVQAPTAIGAREVTLHASVNPQEPAPNTLGTTYRLQYSSGELNQAHEQIWNTAAEGSIPPGESAVPVSQTVSSLLPLTEYHVRILAEKELGSGTTLSTEESFTTASERPTVEAESATAIEAKSATLRARVDANNLPSTDQFEYGTTSAYGTTTQVSSMATGANASPTEVQVRITGLQPETTYHFRVIANNGAGTAQGTDETLVTAANPQASAQACPNEDARKGASADLPDCRAYEQVTPTDKGSAEDMFASAGGVNYTFGRPSENGERFLLETGSSLGTTGVSNVNLYLFSRGSGGWSMTSLGQDIPSVQSLVAEALTPNLSQVAIRDFVGTTVEGFKFERLAGPPGGPYAQLPETGAGEAVGLSESGDVLLQGTEHETGPAREQDPGSRAIWDWSDGSLSLVNVNSAGTLLSKCGAALGFGDEFAPRQTTHSAVSADGSKVFFTAPDPYAEGEGCWNPETHENAPQVYMRAEGRTVEVSAPEAGVKDSTGPHPSVFAGASADGSKVFFLSDQQLTRDDPGHSLELYEYDTNAPEGQRLTRVSRGESGTAEGGVDFVGAISADGSSVYFTASGKLAAGAKEGEGAANLYRYDTTTGKTTFIAAINANDYPLTESEVAGGKWWRRDPSFGGNDELALDAKSEWYTTSNGRYLVFGTSRDLTGFDNRKAPGTQCRSMYPGGETPEGCVELYRYSADAQANHEASLTCVSCVGGRPVDDALFDESKNGTVNEGPPRPISEDGSRVAFETGSALVPGASEGVIHVYEWHDGKVALLSAAQDTSDSFFFGMSADGSDVFIGTHAQLVPQDTDGYGDLYDARVDGGTTSVTAPVCTGAGCQGVPAAPPIFATPASVTFAGAGNLTPQPAGAPAPPKSKRATRQQKLARALEACRKLHSEHRRKQCQRQARRRYAGTSSGHHGRKK